jgi:hypothetical protein
VKQVLLKPLKCYSGETHNVKVKCQDAFVNRTPCKFFLIMIFFLRIVLLELEYILMFGDHVKPYKNVKKNCIRTGRRPVSLLNARPHRGSEGRQMAEGNRSINRGKLMIMIMAKLPTKVFALL